MRLPDPARSQVILVGAAEYRNESDLPALPAVANNLDDLRGALADPTHGWLTPQACTTILNPTNPGDLGITIAERAARADDLVLIYYAGHGLLSSRGELYLATSGTVRGQLRFSAFPYDGMREILADSPAANRVVILDCCYSGRAIAAMTDPRSAAFDQLDITGTYILTSTTATTTAHAPEGARNTAFTAELVTLLRSGDPSIPELITLDHIYRATYRSLVRQGLPRPQQRGSDATPQLALIRNPALDRRPPETESALEEPAVGGAQPVSNARGRGVGLAMVAAAQLLVAVFGALVAGASVDETRVQRLPDFATSFWLDLIYVLPFVTLVLLAGRLGGVFGHRRLFRSGLVALSAGALLTGLADSLPLLIVAFVTAGIGAAFVTANGLALLRVAFGAARAVAPAVFIAVTGGGAAIGVSLTSAVFQSTGWSLGLAVVFALGVPQAGSWFVACELIAIIGLVIALVARVLHEPARRVGRVMPFRVIVPTVGVGLLAFGLLYGDRAGQHVGGFANRSSPAAWVPLIAAAVVLVPYALTWGRQLSSVVPYAMLFLASALATLTPSMAFARGHPSYYAVADYLPAGVGLPVGALAALLLVRRCDLRLIGVLGGVASAAGLVIPYIAAPTVFLGAVGVGALSYCGAIAAWAGMDDVDPGPAAGAFNLVWLTGGICANAAWALQYRVGEPSHFVDYLLLISPVMAVIVGLLPLIGPRFRT